MSCLFLISTATPVRLYTLGLGSMGNLLHVLQAFLYSASLQTIQLTNSGACSTRIHVPTHLDCMAVTAFALNSPTSLALILVPTKFYALKECSVTIHTKSVTIHTKLVTIHTKNLQTLMIEIFKTQNNVNPSFMNEIFRERVNMHNLRNNNELVLPRIKTVNFGSESIR